MTHAKAMENIMATTERLKALEKENAELRLQLAEAKLLQDKPTTITQEDTRRETNH